jgi:tetratricopeptide (TPR) repeat protein
MESQLAVTVAAFMALSGSFAALAQSDPREKQAALDRAFDGGNGLMEEGKYCEALARYQDGLAILPNDPSLLYNAGMAAYKCKDYAESVKRWGRLKALDPVDWQVRAKLVQAYQTLGQFQNRDAERAALFEMRKQGVNEDLSKQLEYCRDQFEAGGERVMAFERFELRGERALKYVFSVVGEKGFAEKYRISLGSYDRTNNMWHQATKPRPADDERLFHLDGYYSWGHATYGMYSPEPSYDEVRKIVVEILEKKRSPISATTVPPSPAKP